jgi:hexosaminidase
MTPAFPTRYFVDFDSATSLETGLRELIEHLPARFSDSPEGHRITFRFEDGLNGYRIVRGAEATEIFYSEKSLAFRGLAVATAREVQPGTIQETRAFSELGVMLDVSRNAVFTVEAVERLFRHFALMGFNTVQLYTEDVYEIEGEPMFGYFRGRYSATELKEIDAYGEIFGIEVIPCIQTLGHLEQVLQWPVYSDIIDSPGILLIGEPATYRLIEKMLDTVSSSFRSRRVHIGMDEAHGVALGRYRRLHGDRRPFDVLNEHLKKVAALCEDRGLKPMIWSDMYFRLGSANNDYYDKESKIPESVAAEIPAGVDLVYWDYYHDDPAFYTDWIARHRNLGKEPILAAGGWTWGRMWTHYGLVEATISAGMKSAREAGLQRAFLTIWGDDGNECDPFSMLTGIQYFAEYAYTSEVTRELVAQRFESACEENLEWVRLGGALDIVESLAPPHDNYANFSKWVLWHDPLLNFLEKLIPSILPEHYRELAAKFRTYCPNEKTAIHHAFATRVAETMALKTRLHLEVRPAYREGQREALLALCNLIPDTVKSFRKLQELHYTIWHEWRKPFGWDTIERRYASVISRLESLRKALERHLANPSVRIPELDEEPCRIGGAEHLHHHHFTYARACSASTLL